MPRLPRPNIPVEVCCRVALRQLGEMWPDQVIEANRRRLGALLKSLRARLAELLGCEVRDLRRDHDPALGAREKIRDRNGEIVGYVPDANDPEHLIYRDKHGHHIKTNVRGDGAQHPDRVLIKRQRRREKVAKPAPQQKRGIRAKRQQWPVRRLKGRSRWPARGTRKIASRRKT